MRKVIQIALSQSEESDEQWALCNDGSLWRFMPILQENWASFQQRRVSEPEAKRHTIKPAGWERMPDVPAEISPEQEPQERAEMIALLQEPQERAEMIALLMEAQNQLTCLGKPIKAIDVLLNKIAVESD